MERSYFVKLKKARLDERGVFVNDIELLTLAQLGEIKDDCELILEPGYVIETTVRKCIAAIHGAVDTEIWRRCREEPSCIIVED
jgi:hypothetical protein